MELDLIKMNEKGEEGDEEEQEIEILLQETLLVCSFTIPISEF
jgi:hypothetical protein